MPGRPYRLKGRIPCVIGLCVVGGRLVASAPPEDRTEPAARAILNMNSYWRWCRTVRPVTYAGAPEQAAPARKDSGRTVNPESMPPPGGWTETGFDDSAWNRARLRTTRSIRGIQDFIDSRSHITALRGRFAVTDPTGIKTLYVSAKYRGGLVVHLNGEEIGRKDLPGGALGENTSALAYSDEAWLGSDGKLIPSAKARQKLSKEEQRDFAERIANRDRDFVVNLPASALRKGVNILAVELRRSTFHPATAQEWFARDRSGRRKHNAKYDIWSPVALQELTLSATGEGVVPNVSRPSGLQVWNHDIHDRICERDYGDPNEPLRPLQMAGARRGSFCSQLVVSSTRPIEAIKVTPASLRAEKGGGTISPGAIEVLYGQSSGRAYQVVNWFDGYTVEAPSVSPVLAIPRWGKEPIPDAAMLPLLFRVTVPGDAASGRYRGQATIEMKGRKPVRVPVALSVADWVVPDPKDYHTFMGIYQSPTSVALRYGVELWSEEHWKLLDKSWALLARAGNKLVNLHVVEQTQFGNDRGMVYWIRNRQPETRNPKPETFSYDFSVFDRFLDMVVKHCGKPDYVALQIWHSGGWATRPADQKNTVTVRNPNTGEFSRLQVPAFNTDEAAAFWQPLLKAVHARLVKRGMGDAMCIGILSDGTAPADVFAMFDKIWPGGGPARWTRGLHASNESAKPYRASKGGGVVVLHEHCYGSRYRGGWLPPVWSFRGKPATAYIRISGFLTAVAPLGYRYMPETALCQGRQGMGRVCLDFWGVKPRSDAKKAVVIYNRYPHSSCAQRAPALYTLSWPGPEGPETTIRYEVLCEGLQEAEALIGISRAIDRHADRLGPELLDECRRVFGDRRHFHKRSRVVWAQVPFHTNRRGWQDLSRRTYDCAAKVARKLGR